MVTLQTRDSASLATAVSTLSHSVTTCLVDASVTQWELGELAVTLALRVSLILQIGNFRLGFKCARSGLAGLFFILVCLIFSLECI